MVPWKCIEKMNQLLLAIKDRRAARERKIISFSIFSLLLNNITVIKF